MFLISISFQIQSVACVPRSTEKLKKKWSNARNLANDVKQEPGLKMEVKKETLQTLKMNPIEPDETVYEIESDDDKKTFSVLQTRKSSPKQEPLKGRPTKEEPIAITPEIAKANLFNGNTGDYESKKRKKVDMTDAGAEYLRSRIKLTETKTDYYESKKKQKLKRHELKVSLLEKLLNR